MTGKGVFRAVDDVLLVIVHSLKKLSVFSGEEVDELRWGKGDSSCLLLSGLLLIQPIASPKPPPPYCPGSLSNCALLLFAPRAMRWV